MANDYVSDVWVLPGGTGIGLRVAGVESTYTIAQLKAALDGTGTDDIADGAVTAAKLATNAVETEKVKAKAVTSAKLADDIQVGSLATLTTTAKTTVVAAINELVTRVAALETAGG